MGDDTNDSGSGVQVAMIEILCSRGGWIFVDVFIVLPVKIQDTPVIEDGYAMYHHVGGKLVKSVTVDGKRAVGYDVKERLQHNIGAKLSTTLG